MASSMTLAPWCTAVQARIMEGMKWHERFAQAWAGLKGSDEKWTQERLAEILEVDQTTISSWLRGRRQPTIDKLERLAVVLDMHPAFLLYGIELDNVVSGRDAAELARNYEKLPQSQRAVIKEVVGTMCQQMRSIHEGHDPYARRWLPQLSDMTEDHVVHDHES